MLRFRVRNRGNRSPVPLGDYHAIATLYTQLLGEKVVAATGKSDFLPLTPVDDYVLTTTVMPEETRKLPAGECTVHLNLTHKMDGTSLRVVKKLFILQETVNTIE